MKVKVFSKSNQNELFLNHKRSKFLATAYVIKSHVQLVQE